jgi:hypothetical protein
MFRFFRNPCIHAVSKNKFSKSAPAGRTLTRETKFNPASVDTGRKELKSFAKFVRFRQTERLLHPQLGRGLHGGEGDTVVPVRLPGVKAVSISTLVIYAPTKEVGRMDKL